MVRVVGVLLGFAVCFGCVVSKEPSFEELVVMAESDGE